MNKISGKLVLMLALALLFTGCAQLKVVQLPKERHRQLELQKSADNLTDKVDVLDEKNSLLSEKQNIEGLDKPEEVAVEIEPDGLYGLEVIEDEEGDLLETASVAETDVSEAPQADEAKKEIVKAEPIILASIGTFSSNRKKQSTKVDYEEAYNLYKKRDFKGAISAFSSFIANYPSTSYTDNAFYWRGECYYAMGEFRKAIDEFDIVEKKFPKGNKVPDAMLKKGYSYIKIKNIPKAKSFFKKVIKLYPSSRSAKKAAEKIDLL